MGFNMALASTIIILFSICCTYFSFSKVRNKFFRLLIFLSVWFLGFLLSIVMVSLISAYVNKVRPEQFGRYIGIGFWISMLGCFLGLWVSRIRPKHAKSEKDEYQKLSISNFKLDINTPHKRLGVVLLVIYVLTFCCLYIYWNFIYDGNYSPIWLYSFDRFLMEFFSFLPATLILWLGLALYLGYLQIFISLSKKMVTWVTNGTFTYSNNQTSTKKQKLLSSTLFLILLFFCLVNIDTSIENGAFETYKNARILTN